MQNLSIVSEFHQDVVFDPWLPKEEWTSTEWKENPWFPKQEGSIPECMSVCIRMWIVMNHCLEALIAIASRAPYVANESIQDALRKCLGVSALCTYACKVQRFVPGAWPRLGSSPDPQGFQDKT